LSCFFMRLMTSSTRPSRAIESQHLRVCPLGSREAGEEHEPAAQIQRLVFELALLLRCLFAFLGTRTLGGLFGQRAGHEPTGKAAALVLKGDGATGLPAPLFFEPGEHVEGFALPIEQR